MKDLVRAGRPPCRAVFHRAASHVHVQTDHPNGPFSGDNYPTRTLSSIFFSGDVHLVSYLIRASCHLSPFTQFKACAMPDSRHRGR